MKISGFCDVGTIEQQNVPETHGCSPLSNSGKCIIVLIAGLTSEACASQLAARAWGIVQTVAAVLWTLQAFIIETLTVVDLRQATGPAAPLTLVFQPNSATSKTAEIYETVKLRRLLMLCVLVTT